MSNAQFIVICSIALIILFAAAGAFSSVHSKERDACIKAGYTWSATKYVCVVNLKK